MPETAADYAAKQREVYGTYVAAVAIDINGARAFNAGDPVPTTHVDAGIVDAEQVAKVSTKAGQAVVASAAEPKG